MRAIGIKGSKGPATALFIQEVPKPVPSDGEVLVRVKAFGLNRMDISQREGRYPVPPQAGPILGVEFSGVVEEVAPYSAGAPFQVGDNVFGLVYGGAYAEYVCVSSRMLIPKPSDWSWEFAAAIPETWMTATQALHLVGRLQPGDRVLWHAGASSVSIAGIQLSLAAGASAVYATVGSDEKVIFTKNLGATDSFNYRTEDWPAAIAEATNNHGVDVVIDYIGQDYFAKNLEVVAKDGRIVILALLSGSVVSGDLQIAPILRKRISICGSNLRGRDLAYQSLLMDELVRRVMPGLRSGVFKVPIERVFSWTDITQAHELMESNTTKGKIVCLVE